ncbi:hypothetical protein ScPMuIL_012351 [Solemya velum]
MELGRLADGLRNVYDCEEALQLQRISFETHKSRLSIHQSFDHSNSAPPASRHQWAIVKMDSWMQEKLFELQRVHSLKPLKEDVVDWLNRTLDIGVTAKTFLDDLETGVYICQLAARVHIAAKESGNKGIPEFKPRYYSKAKRGTFYARDNTANFIQWCKNLGVKDGCIFESEDLVSHRSEKSVILCLLEVSRIVWKFGIEPPDIVKIQKEMESMERIEKGKESKVDNIDGLAETISELKCAPSLETTNRQTTTCRRGSEGQTIPETPSYKLLIDIIDNSQSGSNESLDKASTHGSVSSLGSVDSGLSTQTLDMTKTAIVTPRKRCSLYDENGRRTPGGLRKPPTPKPRTPHCKKQVVIDLDDEVVRISLVCRCEEYVEKVSNGKYRIFEKEVLVRVLGERNIMVRVGGGWQTLEQYLKHHKKKWLQQEVAGSVSNCTPQKRRPSSTKGR